MRPTGFRSLFINTRTLDQPSVQCFVPSTLAGDTFVPLFSRTTTALTAELDLQPRTCSWYRNETTTMSNGTLGTALNYHGDGGSGILHAPQILCISNHNRFWRELMHLHRGGKLNRIFEIYWSDASQKQEQFMALRSLRSATCQTFKLIVERKHNNM